MIINMQPQSENIMNMIIAFMTNAGYIESVDELDDTAWQELSSNINSELTKATKHARASTSTKKLKDPNAPKRNRSAYQIFCDDIRARVTNDLQTEMDKTSTADENGKKPKVALGAVSKKLAELWKALKEEATTKPKSVQARKYKTYEESALKDKERYSKDMESYERPSDEELMSLKVNQRRRSSEKKQRDPALPKRPVNAYNVFCTKKRGELELKGADATRELARMWKEMKESTDADDVELVEQCKAEAQESSDAYKEAMKNYKPSDGFEAPKKQYKTKTKSDSKTKTKDDSPKKWNAFHFFSHHMEERAREECGEEAKAPDVRAKLSAMWKEAQTSEEKEMVMLVSWCRQQAMLCKNYWSVVDEDEEDAKAIWERIKKGNEVGPTAPTTTSDDEETVVDVDTDQEESKTKKTKTTRKAKKSEQSGDEEKPKKKTVRRKSGWIAFQKAMRPQIKEENEDLTAGEVTAKLSEMWSEMDDEEKKEWTEKANE